MSASAISWRPAPRFGHPEVFALLGAASFLAARFLPVLSLPLACPLRGWLGIPCATCGMTHAFVALAHGELARAVVASPAGALLAAGAWLYAAADLVRAAAGWPLPVLSPRLARAAIGAGLATLLASWIWLLAQGVGR